MRVLVTSDYRTLSGTAAQFVIDAVQAKSDARIALPTGDTPLGMYEELVRQYRDGHVDFSQVWTFNLDEYVGLSQDDPNSYHTYMRRHFFDEVNVDPAHCHIP